METRRFSAAARGPRARRATAAPIASLLTAVLVGGFGAAALEGQQYVLPGTPMRGADSPSKSHFQDRLKESPWRAGPFYLSPWGGLRDASFVNNLGGQGPSQSGESDFTATVGAGLRGYLSTGSKVLFAAHALPEYVWWQDTDSKSRLNGRYGLGAFVFFNRMHLQLSQRRIEQQAFFSTEIQSLTSSRTDVSTFGIDVEIARNLSLYGLATRQDYRNEEVENATFSLLDRESDSAAIGLRYENDEGWRVELGFEDRSVDFAQAARNLSNSGTATLAKIGLQRNAIGFQLALALENRDGDEGSEFGSFDGATGGLDVLWRPSPRLAVLTYVRRAQTYSVDRLNAYLEAQRQGARLNFDFDRVTLGIFGEVGEDDYQAVTPGTANRIEDVSAYGAELRVTLREVSLSGRAYRTDYDSALEEFDRDVTSVQFGIEIEAISRFTTRLIDKLSLGSGGTEW